VTHSNLGGINGDEHGNFHDAVLIRSVVRQFRNSTERPAKYRYTGTTDRINGCDECADFTGFCADLTVGSVGSSDE